MAIRVRAVVVIGRASRLWRGGGAHIKGGNHDQIEHLVRRLGVRSDSVAIDSFDGGECKQPRADSGSGDDHHRDRWGFIRGRVPGGLPR